MGYLQRKEHVAKDGKKTVAWRVRYHDRDGMLRSKTFRRKLDADRFKATTEADMLRGTWVDPAHGQRLFGEVAKHWRENLVLEEGSLQSIDNALKNHILPAFEKKPIGGILRSHIQAWIKDRSAVLAPSTLEVTYRHLGAIFHAAEGDRIINKTPCVDIKLPAIVRPPIVPMTTEQVGAVMEALPARYRGLVLAGAGAGLRPGEAAGLTVPWVWFLKREIRVEQQLWTPQSGPLVMKRPKRGSVGTIPVGEAVVTGLARHLEEFPPVTEVKGVNGQPEPLLFTDDQGRPLRRQRWNEIWNRAAKAAELPPGTTPHDLRHYYASLLIARGASVKAVQARLRHKTATETLETYTHLWPDDTTLTRAAVDAELGPLVGVADPAAPLTRPTEGTAG